MFAGDVVYVDRMLGVIGASDSRAWLAAFAAVAALEPTHIVPGHGAPATLAKARAQTYDYLRHLRTEVGKVLEAGGGIEEAVAIDQSAFSHLAVFDQLSRRNAQQVFIRMEWE